MQAFDTIVVRAQNAWFAARDEESGQTLVEYALIIALIAIGSIAALGILSGKLAGFFTKAANQVGNATP